MSIYKEINPGDIKSSKSFLNQLIDVLQEDISGSTSRRKYQHFVTSSGASVGVTSSLFQTVYDQDFTLQTANPVVDMTVGLFGDGTTAGAPAYDAKTGTDSSGKDLYPSSSLMMREKVDIYRQFAQSLLGSSTSQFFAPVDSTTSTDGINTALFLAFKRLFARDQIKRETFAMKWYVSASSGLNNIHTPNVDGASIYTDIGAATNKVVTAGGEVGNLVDASDTSNAVGLIFYDRGIAVLDLAKITSGTQFMHGQIDAISTAGYTTLGGAGTETAGLSKFIPDFVVSASIDNIVDHCAGVRMQSGSLTAITFQNVTNINSTLVFCRAAADEFNYSSNPTYIDSENRIVVIDPGQESEQQSFTMITTIGLFDANDNLLCTAKTSRPIEKSSERDLTMRIRIDY